MLPTNVTITNFLPKTYHLFCLQRRLKIINRYINHVNMLIHNFNFIREREKKEKYKNIKYFLSFYIKRRHFDSNFIWQYEKILPSTTTFRLFYNNTDRKTIDNKRKSPLTLKKTSLKGKSIQICQIYFL